MKRNFKGHNARYIKRQAKNIKKELGITHTEALNRSAIAVGFSGWEHFINQSAPVQSAVIPVSYPRPLAPNPLTLNYRMFFSSKNLQRPNARLSIVAHEQIGGMLKVLKAATEKNKRAYKQFAEVANQLDDWTQQEYRSNRELPDEVFFEMYYGDIDIPIEYSPSQERIDELHGLCQQIKVLLQNGYHDCKPVRELLDRMDQGGKWLASWPTSIRDRAYNRRDVLVPRGSLVYFKGTKIPAIVISHDVDNGTIACYADKGPSKVSRQGITVPKNPIQAEHFRPQRLWLPYGKFTGADGKQTLFNRDYIPLWTKLPDGKVIQAAANTRLEDGQKEFFFKDGSAP